MVIALGHKDLGFNLPEQYRAVQKTAKLITEFVKKGYQIAIVFSNAPQVGMIHTAMITPGLIRGYFTSPHFGHFTMRSL